MRLLVPATALLVVSACSGGTRTTSMPPCAPTLGALTIAQAKRATPGADITVAAWLWEYRPPIDCDCPPNTPCAACPEVFHVFGDAPAPRSPPDLGALDVELPELRWRPSRGAHYLLRGFHHGQPDFHGRQQGLFTATAITPICPEG